MNVFPGACKGSHFAYVLPPSAQKLADLLGIPFIETSALDKTNIEQCFLNISKDLLTNR
jgi:hypothetical protein